MTAVPPEWEETIQACLAKDPEQRPQSAGEVAWRLGVGPALPPSPELLKTGAVAPRRRVALRWALVGAAIVAIAATTWWLLRESAPREFTVTVDPPGASARLWLGPASNVEVKDGRAVLKDLPDGEQDLIVQAPGYQPSTTRVTVRHGRGSVEAKLEAVRGAVAVTARSGTQVTAVDERGRETRLGAVPAGGVLEAGNLLTVGRYALRLEHADCAAVTVSNVELMPGRTAKVAPAQTPLPGELRVFSVPTGAEVRVDGAVAGTTPATLKNQPSEQALRLEVFLRGYQRLEQAVTLKPREVRVVNVGTLTAESGGIELRFGNYDLRLGRPAISVDGKAIEVARVSDIASGPVVPNAPFAIERSRSWQPHGRDRASRLRAVAAGGDRARPGNDGCKRGAEAQVRRGGVRDNAGGGASGDQRRGPARHRVYRQSDAGGEPDPAAGTLPPGEYTLRFELKGYKAATRTVTVAANRAVEVSVPLEKLRAAEEGQAWTVPDLNLEMAYIRPGTFTMGSPNSEEGRSMMRGRRRG